MLGRGKSRYKSLEYIFRRGKWYVIYCGWSRERAGWRCYRVDGDGFFRVDEGVFFCRIGILRSY